MEIKASANYVRINPRKLRLITHGLVGSPAKKVIERLGFYPQEKAEILLKTLKQGVANAEKNFNLSDELFIKKIEVNEGPSFKKMDKSHGARFDRGVIKKKTSHLLIILESREKVNKLVAKEARGTKS